MTRSRSGTRRTRRPSRPAAAPESTTQPTGEDEKATGWAQLSRGTKALAVLVATTAIATVVPGVIPYVSDRVLDVLGAPLVRVDTEIGPSEGGVYLAAAGAVAAQPPDPLRDSRFVAAGHSPTKLTLEGRRSAGIAVVDMTVEVVAREPVRTGTLFAIPPQGDAENGAMEVNLDAAIPVAAAAGSGKPYFAAKRVTLARGEVWVGTVTARTTRCECAWRLHLKLRYRGNQHEVVVPPVDRAPLRMTGFAGKPDDYAVQYVWKPDGIARLDCAVDRKACAATDLPPLGRR
ncbi:hypothetical protein ACSNN9_03225 [Micromonospora sp. URMC 107]|uniref:hypothetical protein n=1 Tax=Micromonospora sp. URMC 107 TaxID=3423418 RepID=UPI003F1BB278